MEQGLAGQSCRALPQAAGTGQGHPGPTDPVQRQPPKQQRGRVPGRDSARNIPILLLTSTLWLYLGSETEPVQLQTEAAAQAAEGRAKGSLCPFCPSAPCNAVALSSPTTSPEGAGQEPGSVASWEQGSGAAHHSRNVTLAISQNTRREAPQGQVTCSPGVHCTQHSDKDGVAQHVSSRSGDRPCGHPSRTRVLSQAAAAPHTVAVMGEAQPVGASPVPGR